MTTYLHPAKQLFLYYPDLHLRSITTVEIEAYQHELVGRNVSNSYLNQLVNAVRYFYKDVVGDASRVTFIERPRAEKKLPMYSARQK